MEIVARRIFSPAATHRSSARWLAIWLGSLSLTWSTELPVCDLRLGVDLRPSDFSYTASNSTGRVEGEDHFDYGFGSSLRVHYRFGADEARGAWLLGAELHGSLHRYEDDDYLQTGVRAITGYTRAIGSSWSLLALARAGYGWGRYDFAGNAYFDADTADGPVIDYGLMLGIRKALTHDIGIQAELGWLIAEGDLSAERFDLEIEEAGVSAFLGLTWRFGGAAPLIIPEARP